MGILQIGEERFAVRVIKVERGYDKPTEITLETMPYVFRNSNLIREAKSYLNKHYGIESASGNGIKDVIFNDPATIVIWADGTKTVVKCQPNDEYNKETGLALCIAKKYLGNKGNFNDVFKKWIPEEKEEKSIEEMREELKDFCSGQICTCCPLELPQGGCNIGTDFRISDEEIKSEYKIVFGSK